MPECIRSNWSLYLKPKAEAKLIDFRETSVPTEDGDSVVCSKKSCQQESETANKAVLKIEFRKKR